MDPPFTFCVWVQNPISGQARCPFLVRAMLEMCFLKFCPWWVVSNHVSNDVPGPFSCLDSLGGLWAQTECFSLSGTDSAARHLHLALPTAFRCCAIVSWLMSWDHPWLPPHPPMWMSPTHWHSSSNYYVSIFSIKKCATFWVCSLVIEEFNIMTHTAILFCFALVFFKP